MYIGIDIGGSKILLGLANAQGRILSTQKLPTPADGRSGLHVIEYRIRELLDGRPLFAIAVSAPGPLDFKTGTILNPPNQHEWHNVPIGPELRRLFKVPVVVENDANAAGLAEAISGAGQTHGTVLYVTISTGIGTGLIIEDEVYHGANDTEGGHITIQPGGPQCGCGGHGHFESVVSGRAIQRRFGRPASAITDAGTWDLIAKDMALGLANLIAITAPDIVVLGGGVSVHWKRFNKPLLAHLKEVASLQYPLPPIVPAKRIETAPLYGTILLAKKAAK